MKTATRPRDRRIAKILEIKTGVDFLGEYLNPGPGPELQAISVLALAHVGDAVFELMARTWLCLKGAQTAKQLHGGAVALVSAKAQAAAAARVLPELSQEELAVYKRGRNARASSIPHGATIEEYHSATGIEALFGYLYLSGSSGRLDELFKIVVGE